MSVDRTFPTSVAAPVLLGNLHATTGKVRSSQPIHRFKHCSVSNAVCW